MIVDRNLQRPSKLVIRKLRERTFNSEPPNPLPKGIRRVKNPWVHTPKVEDFYQQFMRAFLASSAETPFHRNDLRGVHTVINEEILKNREIRHEGDKLIDGLKGRVGKIGAHLQVLISEKET